MSNNNDNNNDNKENKESKNDEDLTLLKAGIQSYFEILKSIEALLNLEYNIQLLQNRLISNQPNVYVDLIGYLKKYQTLKPCKCSLCPHSNITYNTTSELNVHWVSMHNSYEVNRVLFMSKNSVHSLVEWSADARGVVEYSVINTTGLDGAPMVLQQFYINIAYQELILDDDVLNDCIIEPGDTIETIDEIKKKIKKLVSKYKEIQLNNIKKKNQKK